MSLVSLALRLATIRALKGRTFAEDRVFDSRIEAIDTLARNETAPIIIVTTDDDEVEIEGRDLFAGNHKHELVIEAAVWTKVATEKDGDALIIPATDAGLEASLNIFCYQIVRALAGDGGEWGDLWRSIVTATPKAASRRGADDSNGVRYAARQLTYTVDHIAEPMPGRMPAEGETWFRILTMLKADPEFAAIGKIVETEIAAVSLMEWEQVRAALGLANDESGWIGSRPVKIDDEVPLDAVELDDGFTLDDAAAQNADGPEDAA